MKKKALPEYLGDISTELVMQNLTNVNHLFSSIDAIREAYPNGFTVTAIIEHEVFESDEERAATPPEVRERMGWTDLEVSGRRLVRLELEPNK